MSRTNNVILGMAIAVTAVGVGYLTNLLPYLSSQFSSKDPVPKASSPEPSKTREKIFEGKVGDWDVLYEEGTGNNYLAARKGAVVLQCYDSDGNRINAFVKGTADFTTDKLERVVYTDGDAARTIVRKDIDPKRFDSDSLVSVMDGADNKYNALRTDIRDKMRKDASAGLDKVLETLK